MTNDEKTLIDNIYKKFQTTMIGSLARFENIFGHLWDEDTKQAEEFAEMWEYARNSILNNGNKQARLATEELSRYFGQGTRKINQKYNYKFYFDNQEGDQYEN